MTNQPTPYSELGIDILKTNPLRKDKSGDSIAVKKAFRRHAQKLHPDRNPPGNGEEMKALNAAYEALTKNKESKQRFEAAVIKQRNARAKELWAKRRSDHADKISAERLKRNRQAQLQKKNEEELLRERQSQLQMGLYEKELGDERVHGYAFGKTLAERIYDSQKIRESDADLKLLSDAVINISIFMRFEKREIIDQIVQGILVASEENSSRFPALATNFIAYASRGYEVTKQLNRIFLGRSGGVQPVADELMRAFAQRPKERHFADRFAECLNDKDNKIKRKRDPYGLFEMFNGQWTDPYKRMTKPDHIKSFNLGFTGAWTNTRDRSKAH